MWAGIHDYLLSLYLRNIRSFSWGLLMIYPEGRHKDHVKSQRSLENFNCVLYQLNPQVPTLQPPRGCCILTEYPRDTAVSLLKLCLYRMAKVSYPVMIPLCHCFLQFRLQKHDYSFPNNLLVLTGFLWRREVSRILNLLPASDPYLWFSGSPFHPRTHTKQNISISYNY